MDLLQLKKFVFDVRLFSSLLKLIILLLFFFFSLPHSFTGTPPFTHSSLSLPPLLGFFSFSLSSISPSLPGILFQSANAIRVSHELTYCPLVTTPTAHYITLCPFLIFTVVFVLYFHRVTHDFFSCFLLIFVFHLALIRLSSFELFLKCPNLLTSTKNHHLLI